MENDIPTDRQIDDGLVKQVLVEYLGPKKGSFTLRGRVSSETYGFSALPSSKYRAVRYEDADWFRQRRDFHVHENTLIDPDLHREHELRSRIEVLEGRLRAETHSRDDDSTGRTTNRIGRPRIPLAIVQRMWHLRHHGYPRWSIPDLVNEFTCEDCVAAAEAMSARLYRFKRDHNDLTGTEHCPFCERDEFPLPPSSI